MPVRGDIGRRVRVARKLANMRVAELAHRLGYVQLTVYRWESGKRDPSKDDCYRIAELTDTRPAWLFTGDGEPRARVA